MDRHSDLSALFQLHHRHSTATFPFSRDKDSVYHIQKKLKKEVEQIKNGH